MDRCFRSAFDALTTIESFKKRKISLWLLDLGGDVSGNGISELMMTVLAAVAQFERTLISERKFSSRVTRNLLILNGPVPGHRLAPVTTKSICRLPHAEPSGETTSSRSREASSRLEFRWREI
jgi:hypothetical protein